jgi:hypothetical protein
MYGGAIMRTPKPALSRGALALVAVLAGATALAGCDRDQAPGEQPMPETTAPEAQEQAPPEATVPPESPPVEGTENAYPPVDESTPPFDEEVAPPDPMQDMPPPEPEPTDDAPPQGG